MLSLLLWVLTVLSSCSGCSSARWGYDISGGTDEYSVSTTRTTPQGVAVDDALEQTNDVTIDLLTGYVESCLQQSIDRSKFVLKIPSNWHQSCDGTQQVLDSEAPEYGCAAKGLTGDCPCRWRSLIQCPNVIVATPNLYLYQDALVRWVTGSANPWGDERLVKCASPIVSP